MNRVSLEIVGWIALEQAGLAMHNMTYRKFCKQ